MSSNEQERSTYNKLIMAKEDAVDDLKKDQRKIEGSLQYLAEDLQRGYQTLSLLNEEDLREGNLRIIHDQRRNEEQEQLFTRQLQAAEEQLSESYAEQRKTLDDETEELYKKRSEIPWD